MKIENRQQFLIVLTIACLALLIGDDVIFEPLLNLWSARSAQIKELRGDINDGKLLIQRETIIRNRWSGMRANALTNNTSLAEQQVLTALDNWSRASGASLTTIRPEWEDDSTNYETLHCHVEATGTLDTLSQFIYDIEKGPMALKLDSAELSERDNTGQQLSLALEINGLALLPPARQ
ncbi:MAG TPA: GspMb/PilO family protein [Verrucomicrobiae bacterium]|nr:GspMb/PilO family protein [Verrucomicrobiae bacterium]